MLTTIDRAGRLVLPKSLRQAVGLEAGEVEVEAVGAEIRVRPVSGGDVLEKDGILVIPDAGVPVDDDLVRALRHADQR